jgi:hypothetical protein
MDDTDKKIIKWTLLYELIFGSDRNQKRALRLILLGVIVAFLVGLCFVALQLIIWTGELLVWLTTTREGRITSVVLLACYGLVRMGMDIWGPVSVPAPAPVPAAIAASTIEPSAEPSPAAGPLPPVAPAPPKPAYKLVIMNEIRPVLADSPIHAGPDPSTPIKDWVHKGNRVRILGKAGDFYVVRKLNGQFGYVRQEDLGEPPIP